MQRDGEGSVIKGAERLMCPECGHVARSEAEWTRRRVRKGWLVLGLLVMALPSALGVFCVRDYLRVRWQGEVTAEAIKVFKGSDVQVYLAKSNDVETAAWVVEATEAVDRWVDPAYAMPGAHPMWAHWVHYYATPRASYGHYWKREVFSELFVSRGKGENLRALGKATWLTKLDVTVEDGRDAGGVVAGDLEGIARMGEMRQLALELPRGLFWAGVLENKLELERLEIELRWNGKKVENYDGVVRVLSGSAPRLADLLLRGMALTDEGLAEAGKLRGLKVLRVEDCRTDGRGLEALARGTKLESFRASLDVTPGSVAGIGGMTELKTLWVEDKRGRVEGAGIFEPWGGLRKLEKLWLDMELTQDGQLEFLKPLQNLRTVRLALNGCEGTGLNAGLMGKTQMLQMELHLERGFKMENLAFLKSFTGLTFLELNCGGVVTPRALGYLPVVKHARRVELLNVRGEDLEELRHAAVKRLDFGREKELTDADVRVIAQNARVEELSIDSDLVTEKGCADLAGMAGLRTLQLGDVTVAAARVLGEGKHLEYIVVFGGKMSAGERAELKKAYPKMQVN